MDIIREREEVLEVYYVREFSYAPHCGFGFPCDENGAVRLASLNICARKNFIDCLEGKHKDLTDMGAVKYERIIKKPAIGKCKCGTHVELINQYMGAFQCPECGRWYNVFGQALNPPTSWED